MAETYALGMELTAPPPTDAALDEAVERVGPPAAAPSAGPAATTAPAARLSLIDPQMPAIRDQGNRGTCVAFATVAVLEYVTGCAHGTLADLSEQCLYWNIKRTDNYSRDGTWLQFAFPLAQRDGVCLETSWPYEGDVRPNDLTHGGPPDPQACSAEAVGYRFSRSIRLNQYQQPDVIKAELRQGRPVAVAIPVFKTWYDSPTVREFGNIVLPLKSDRFAVGGHAIVLVGFEDDPGSPGGGYFIVRNSWGDRWGTESPYTPGYGTLPYGYIAKYNADAWTGEG